MAAKDPNDRYQDYDSLLADLQRVRSGLAPVAPLPTRSKGFWGSPKTLVGIAAALIVIAGAVASLLLHPETKPIPPVAVATPVTISPDQTPMADIRNEPEGRAYDERRADTRRTPREEMRAGPGGPREGPGGGAAGRGRRAMPHGPPPAPNHTPLVDGPVETMFAQADAMAAQKDPVYIEVVNAYGQVREKAKDGAIGRRAAEKMEAWMGRHRSAARKAVADYTMAMNEKLASGSEADAVGVWADFPASLRSYEIDHEIIDIVSRAVPNWEDHVRDRR